MKLCLLFLSFAFLSACANKAVVTPIADVGCTVETAVTGGIAQSVATALSCTSVSAIQTSLQTALGNVNLCSQATAAQASVKTMVIKPKGLVGNIACPLAISTVIGYLSNSVPSAWNCSTGATVASLTAVLTTACEAAVPL